MESSPNVVVFETVIERGFNQGDFDAWDDCFSPDFSEHQYGLPQSLAGFKRAIEGLRRAMPDLVLTIDACVTSGDTLWARLTAQGTHQGPFMGFEPTGRRFSATIIDVCRFDGGRIVEHWGVPDRFAILDQLGLLPPSPRLGRPPSPSGPVTGSSL